MTKYIICDLDGTIADARHRESLAQMKQWDDFHKASVADEVFPDVIRVLEAFRHQYETSFEKAGEGLEIILLTGRNNRYRQLTMDWLKKHEIDHLFDDLIMRFDDDFSSDVVVKPKMIELLFGSHEKAKEDILLFLEDRDKVVEAWRNLGYPCFQVRPGGY